MLANTVVNMTVLGHYQCVAQREPLKCTLAHPHRSLAYGKHKIRSKWLILFQSVGDRLPPGYRVNRRPPYLC